MTIHSRRHTLTEVTSQQSRVLACALRAHPSNWTPAQHAQKLGLPVPLVESILARWDITHSRTALSQSRHHRAPHFTLEGKARAKAALDAVVDEAKEQAERWPAMQFKKGPLQW